MLPSPLLTLSGMPEQSGRGLFYALTSPSSADEAFVLAADIQMRIVSEREDAYWHTQFAQEPYYVAGRGYDQYRPAYKLGWKLALQHPDADFTDLAQILEIQWSERSGTSLLPWREVHLAVKSAWEHASAEMRAIQQPTPSLQAGHHVVSVVRPLHAACQSLADDLVHMHFAPVHDFVQQVLDRHIQLLLELAQELKPWLGPEGAIQGMSGLLPERLQQRWVKFKSSFFEWTPEQVFEACEQRERSLLADYQHALLKDLPTSVKDLLAQQMKALQHNFDQISWIRHNWLL